MIRRSRLRRTALLIAGVAAIGLAAADGQAVEPTGTTATAAPGLRLPAAVMQQAGALQTLGRAELRWFGLRIYDAALWGAAGAAWSAERTHALEIRYARDIQGARLVDTSIEEIARLGFGDAARHARWRAALARVLPDVAAGDTLVGLHLPGEGAGFWHGERKTGEIDDPELARAFFAIWLDPRTREPVMRNRLLGEAGPQVRHQDARR